MIRVNHAYFSRTAQKAFFSALAPQEKKHSFCKKNLFQLSMNVGVASELAWNDFPKVSRLNKKHQ